MAQKKIPVANKQTRIVGGEKVTPCELLGPTVIDLVQAGMTPSRAAEAAGLVKSTVSKWISRGLEEQFKIEKGELANPDEKPYLDFVEGIVKAEAVSQGGLVMAWFKEARSGDWKAAQQFLARRWPNEWGDNNTVRLEVTSGFGSGQPQEIKHTTLQEDEDKKRAILSALVEAGDLPANVLGAWDGNQDVIDAEIIEEK